jgi:hypothetical protein
LLRVSSRCWHRGIFEQLELTSDKSVPDQQRFQKTWQGKSMKKQDGVEMELRWRAARDNRRSDWSAVWHYFADCRGVPLCCFVSAQLKEAHFWAMAEEYQTGCSPQNSDVLILGRQ